MHPPPIHPKLRWGILSTARIGLEKVIPGIMRSAHSEVVAIASRDRGRAEAAATALGIERAFASYEALLADPGVDAIYNPLPNHLHVPLTLAAARAGKHVLCEKPIALSAAQAVELRALPARPLVMEAFMIRFHPQWRRAAEIVRSGELGEVRAIAATFCYFNDDPADVRNRADIGGGAILDIGCYPIVAARLLFGSEPLRVVALADYDPRFATDRLVSAIADFGGGRRLSFTISTQAAGHQRLEVLGTGARLEIVIPFNAPQGEPVSIAVGHGPPFDGSTYRRQTLPPADQYAEEAEAFALAALGMAPLPYGLEDAIANMRALDALAASARGDGWVAVAHA